MNSWEKGISCMGASGSPKEINPGIHFYWLLKNPPFIFQVSLFSPMNPDSPFPSVTWEVDGDPCETQEKALSAIKNNMEAFIICTRGNDFLQAICDDPESYHCEMSFAAGKKRELYVAPDNVNYSQLCDLFSRYAAGEDFSHLKEEWTLYVNKTHFYTSLIIGLLVLGIAIFLLFRSPNF